MTVYRLVTTKSYEQEMFHRASLKLGLDQAVKSAMGEGEGKEGESELQNGVSDEELERMLKVREQERKKEPGN